MGVRRAKTLLLPGRPKPSKPTREPWECSQRPAKHDPEEYPEYPAGTGSHEITKGMPCACSGCKPCEAPTTQPTIRYTQVSRAQVREELQLLRG